MSFARAGGIMQCPQCHKENKAGRKFCSACGSALPLPCSACGFENEPDDQFCGGCGKAMVPSSPSPAVSPQSASPKLWTPRHLAERILAEQTAIASRADTDGERKTITALFADVAGFTTLTQALDPEDVCQLIDPVLHLMMEAVYRYDGYVAQSLGDGIFALFGALLAHKDHAQRALYAALRMQEEMRRYADRLRLERGIPLQIRVGINTGEVVLGAGSSSSQAPNLKPQAPMGEMKEAEGYFLKAIDIAQRQQAKSLELRASTSLARLWQSQGKQHEAHRVLSKVYNWFTEGFDTKDLQEATALIEELRY